MKFNKWTLGLAAVGAISLVPAARADEKLNALNTALSNTTISGSVSASMNWAIAPGGGQNEDSPAGFIPFQAGKQDGFNLDVVRLTIAKPEDESPWASGYQVDLMFGPDANGYNTSVGSINGNSNPSEFGIKQAYVTLRTPVGNGIDWKIGVFDTVIGYEVTDAGNNPNYTRSIGYNVEPTEHTGILGIYKINDQWSVSAGVANTLSAGINIRDMSSGAFNGAGSDWKKTLLGSITYTAPSSWGWAAGSSFYAGVVYGFAGGSYQSGYQQNYYAGVTLNTPWKQLTTGFAFDYVRNIGGGSEFAFNDGEFAESETRRTDTYVIGAYVTYKATDKLSINGRAEFVHSATDIGFKGTDFETTPPSPIIGPAGFASDGYEVTGTVEYDMWANVITRAELRFDHDNGFNGFEEHEDSLGFYANVIYKF